MEKIQFILEGKNKFYSMHNMLSQKVKNIKSCVPWIVWEFLFNLKSGDERKKYFPLRSEMRFRSKEACGYRPIQNL